MINLLRNKIIELKKNENYYIKEIQDFKKNIEVLNNNNQLIKHKYNSIMDKYNKNIYNIETYQSELLQNDELKKENIKLKKDNESYKNFINQLNKEDNNKEVC